MVRMVLLATAALVCAVPSAAATSTYRRAAHGRHHRSAHRRAGLRHGDVGGSYGSAASPTPTCRYPDGTPYDPDIIGGPNHVGDGGPAVNLGGFDPCGS